MLFYLRWTFATLDIAFNAFINQNLSEFVFPSPHVELSESTQSVSQGLIIVIEVEVKFGQENGHDWSIGERLIFIECLSKSKDGYMRLISLAMSIQ